MLINLHELFEAICPWVNNICHYYFSLKMTFYILERFLKLYYVNSVLHIRCRATTAMKSTWEPSNIISTLHQLLIFNVDNSSTLKPRMDDATSKMNIQCNHYRWFTTVFIVLVSHDNEVIKMQEKLCTLHEMLTQENTTDTQMGQGVEYRIKHKQNQALVSYRNRKLINQ